MRISKPYARASLSVDAYGSVGRVPLGTPAGMRKADFFITKETSVENVPYFGPGHSKPEDAQEPGGDVKEPPLPRSEDNEEKFPRKGELESGVEDGARID